MLGCLPNQAPGPRVPSENSTSHGRSGKLRPRLANSLAEVLTCAPSLSACAWLGPSVSLSAGCLSEPQRQWSSGAPSPRTGGTSAGPDRQGRGCERRNLSDRLPSHPGVGTGEAEGRGRAWGTIPPTTNIAQFYLPRLPPTALPAVPKAPGAPLQLVLECRVRPQGL